MSQQPRRSHAPAPAPARGQPARSAQDKENDQVHHDASDRLSRSGNENPGPRASTKTHSQGHHANTAATSNDDDEDDNDGDQARPGELHGDHDGDSDGESPVRPRVRRMSAKQIQLAEEVEAAEARKAAKVTQAAKTAKKRQLQAVGLDDDEAPEPRRDDTFTSRMVPSRPKTTKALVQRDNRVPPPPKFPSGNWYRPTTTSTHHDDGERDMRDTHHNRTDFERHGHSSRDKTPVTFRGRSPAPMVRAPAPPEMYNINGGRVPDRLTLNLHHGRDDYDEDNSSRTRPPPRPFSPAVFDKRAGCDDYDDSSHTHPVRPISPAVGDKRARSPEDSDDLRTVQAQRTGAATGRPKAKDFDDVTQEVIALAIKLYRCHVSMRYGFPDSAKELEFLRKAWAEACLRLNIVMDLTPTISKLITNRASHVRGELKTKMTDPVDLMCGFKSGHSKKVVAYNRELAESLKEDLTFTFKDPKTRKGIYRAALIQKSINIMWFANSRDEGVSFPEFFNPITKPGLALVLTVAENLIDERLTGIRNNIPFTANEYRSVYDSHLKALEEFDEQTQPYKILNNILIRLHNIGRFHSGAQPFTAVKKSALNKTDVAAAIREYEDDSETETEAEDGGADARDDDAA